MTSERLLNFLISLSLSGTILFGIWLISTRVLKKSVSHRVFYYLLLVILLRFIIPVAPNQSVVGTTFSAIKSTSFYSTIYGIRENKNPTVYVGDNVVIGNNLVIGSKSKDFSPYILYVWLTVAFSLLVRKITKYQSFSRYMRSDWHPVDDPTVLDLVSSICEEKKITTPVEVHTSALISSPLLFGIRKSYIVLPHLDLTETQLYSVLSHELTHYKSKDLFYKWFMQLVLCVHWFNPVIYYIEKRMNKECEYACDEATTHHFTKEQRYEYGTTLIEMAKSPDKYNEKVASVTLYENTKEIKNRLDILVSSNKNQRIKLVATMIFVFIVTYSAIILGAYATPQETNPIEKLPTDSSTETDISKKQPLGRPFSK